MGKKSKESKSTLNVTSVTDDVVMEDKSITTATLNGAVMDCQSHRDADAAQPENYFVSPIAQPLLKGKLLERGIKLLKKAVAHEKVAKESGKGSKTSLRQLKRGVAEVTKAIRKGQKGLVFIAADVYPIDIVAHFPVYCEDNGVLYSFTGTKRMLGAACRTKRPASVVMVCAPASDMAHHELYNKFYTALKEYHPYF